MFNGSSPGHRTTRGMTSLLVPHLWSVPCQVPVHDSCPARTGSAKNMETSSLHNLCFLFSRRPAPTRSCARGPAAGVYGSNCFWIGCRSGHTTIAPAAFFEALVRQVSEWDDTSHSFEPISFIERLLLLLTAANLAYPLRRAAGSFRRCGIFCEAHAGVLE